MQNPFPVLCLLAGVSLLSWFSASGQTPPEGRSRGGRLKPGEIVTPADRGVKWQNQLQVGEPAPPFTLPLLSIEKNSSQNAKREAETTVSLDKLRAERPVVLIFGSLTCPPFRGQLENVDALYDQFKDRAEFLFVYIREAHPDSIVSVLDESGNETLLKIVQPKDDTTRTSTAATCQRTTDLRMPVAVDGLENAVGQAYAGWPNRMVVVGTDGNIMMASAPSPRGTDARRLRLWLEENLPATN